MIFIIIIESVYCPTPRFIWCRHETKMQKIINAKMNIMRKKKKDVHTEKDTQVGLGLSLEKIWPRDGSTRNDGSTISK